MDARPMPEFKTTTVSSSSPSQVTMDRAIDRAASEHGKNGWLLVGVIWDGPTRARLNFTRDRQPPVPAPDQDVMPHLVSVLQSLNTILESLGSGIITVNTPRRVASVRERDDQQLVQLGTPLNGKGVSTST